MHDRQQGRFVHLLQETLAAVSAAPNTSRLTAPAKALATPSRAIARATFQVEPPTWLIQLSAPVLSMSVSASPADTKRGSALTTCSR